jgi:nucleoside-diphosphate-sugar epimerase
MNTIVIIGASGYIGRNLVAELKTKGNHRIKVLSRANSKIEKTDGVEFFEGDIFDIQSLSGFLEPGCIVVNLVYLWNDGEEKNLTLISNLLHLCKTTKIKRLIHCSTAAVAGRVSNDLITESTLCHPISEYGITKLKVEHLIIEEARGNFDAVILRPTSVFGPGAEPLRKLAADIVSGSRFRNYLKSCLFGKRRMNLVHITNVVASILFMAAKEESLNGEVFIVSDDDSPINNFIDVECTLMKEFNIKTYRMPYIPLPSWILKFLLLCLGRNNINPFCNFDSKKIINFGYQRPKDFESGLVEYATWYHSVYRNKMKRTSN